MNLSSNRASLRSFLINLGLFCILAGLGQTGQLAAAADATKANPEAGKRFATVFRLRGDVAASQFGSSGSERKLREGDPVFVGERVRTASLAEAVLKTEDAGFVAIRPGTEFVAERFAAEDKPTDGFAVRLVTGSLRMISGWVSRTNRAGNKVVTPTATIGIRGTDHEPYVLSAELAKKTSNPEGTYDKVNRGGTTLEVGDNKLDIDAGRVGFARGSLPPPAAKQDKNFRERALMTLLLPVLLDKVPNFYVPGEFDAELDRYSQTADQDNLRQLEQRRKSPPAPGTPSTAAPSVVAGKAPAAAAAATASQPAATPAAAGTAPAGACDPIGIAKTWLGQLDGAIVKHDAKSIVSLFGPDATARANVKDKEGKIVSVDLSRDELAQSTIAAMKGLKDYKQRRVWTDAKTISGAACERLNVRSVVIEQGKQSGKPYRFESLEEYTLELRLGKWLAVKAETTQQ